MSERVKFVVTFVPVPGGDDSSIRALRAVLKISLRRYGLRAVDVREENAPASDAAPDISNQIADAFAGLRRDVRNNKLRERSS